MAHSPPPEGWLVSVEELDANHEVRRYAYMDGTAINVVLPRGVIRTPSDAYIAATAKSPPPPPRKAGEVR